MNRVTDELLRDMRDMLRDHVLQVSLDEERWKAFYLRDPRCNLGRMQSTCILFTPEGIVIFGDLCPGNDDRNSGVMSNFGYGLSWFSGRLDGRYLCEKFLAKGFQKEVAVEELRDLAAAVRRGDPDGAPDALRDPALRKILETRLETADAIRRLRAVLRSGDVTPSDKALAEADICLHRQQADRHGLVRRREELAERYEELARDVDLAEKGYETFGEEYRHLTRDDDWYEDCPGYTYPPRAAALLIAIQEKFAELYGKLAHSESVGDRK